MKHDVSLTEDLKYFLKDKRALEDAYLVVTAQTEYNNVEIESTSLGQFDKETMKFVLDCGIDCALQLSQGEIKEQTDYLANIYQLTDEQFAIGGIREIISETRQNNSGAVESLHNPLEGVTEVILSGEYL